MLVDPWSYQCVPANLCPVTWQYDFYGSAHEYDYQNNYGGCYRSWNWYKDEWALDYTKYNHDTDDHMYVSFNWYYMTYTEDVFTNGRDAPWPLIAH